MQKWTFNETRLQARQNSVLHHTTDSFSLGFPKITSWLWVSQNLCCVTAWGHFVFPMGHLEPTVPYKGGSSSWRVEPCWALNGSHLSAPSAAGLNSPDPSLSGGIWQPSTAAFPIFHHLQQQQESGGLGCSAKQRDKGCFPKSCNPALHK